MGEHDPSVEGHTLRGPTDRAALIAARDVFDAEEPLATARLDDYIDPSVLEVTLDDGLRGADSARIDVEWTTRGDYKFHYTDSCGVNVRWGKHLHDGDYHAVSELEHYHPPPEASADPTEVEDSCIEHARTQLVARAVLVLWRAAYHAGSFAPLNAGRNPP